MRIVVMLLIFCHSAMAFQCEDARRDLLALENALLEGKLPICGGEEGYQLPNCCDPSQPNNYKCKTRMELEREYNEKVGELIIAEGIVALGMATESSHNSLIQIPSAELTKARDNAQELELRLTQANLLYQALEVPNENAPTIWTDLDFTEYRIQGRDFLDRYIASQCEAEPFSTQSFCQQLNELARSTDADKKALHAETLKMLHGFMTAFSPNDLSVSNRPETRNRRFKAYQKQLKITIQGDQTELSPGEFIESDHYGKVQSMADDIDQYLSQIAEGNRSNSTDLAQKIREQSASLNAIRVQYAQPVSAEAIENDPVIGFLTSPQSFYNSIAQIGMRDLLPLNTGVKKNFEATASLLNNDLKRLENSFNKEVNDKLFKIKSQIVEGKSIESICKSSYDRACIDSLCEVIGNQCRNVPETLRRVGIGELISAHKSFDNYEKTNSHLQAAKACLDESDGSKTLTAQKQCLHEIADKFNKISMTQIDQLKEEVKLLEDYMHDQNFIEPFKTLNLEKAMTLDIINSKACNKASLPKININRNYCLHPRDNRGGREDIASNGRRNSRNINEQYVGLSVDSNEILIKLNHASIENAIQDNGGVEITDANRTNLETRCQGETSEVKSRSICAYFTQKAAHEAEIARRQKEREAKGGTEIRIRRRDDGPSDWELVGRGVLDAAPFVITPLIGAAVERQAVKDTTRSMKRSIVAYDNWYMENLPLWREYYENPPQVTATNWGYDFNQAYSFDNSASFQSSRTNTNFARNNGVQFSFTPIPTSLGSGGIPTTGTTRTSTGGTTFSYGF